MSRLLTHDELVEIKKLLLYVAEEDLDGTRYEDYIRLCHAVGQQLSLTNELFVEYLREIQAGYPDDPGMTEHSRKFVRSYVE